MDRLVNIQTFGTLVVLIAFIGAELAAWYLVIFPSSQLAWYLNLGPFHIFETARNSSSAIHYLFAPHSFTIAVAALLVVLLARHLRFRLLVAMGANLSFAFVIALIDAEIRTRSAMSAETLISILVKHEYAGAVGVILLASGIACLASHASFLLAIQSEANLQRYSSRRMSSDTLIPSTPSGLVVAT